VPAVVAATGLAIQIVMNETYLSGTDLTDANQRPDDIANSVSSWALGLSTTPNFHDRVES